MKHLIGAACKFNQTISEKYKKYRTEIEQIDRRLWDISRKSNATIDSERIELIRRREELRNAVFKLAPFNRMKFKAYANKMLDYVAREILNNDFMTKCIVNWSNIDIKTKEQFGRNLLAALDKHYRETDATVAFSIDNESELIASYDWNGNIYFRNDIFLTSTPNNFIGTLLHEFMHYLCDKHPNKSHLGAQLSFIATRHYLTFFGGLKNKSQFDTYKKQPFERYAYEIQDYVNDSDFTKNLLAAISIRCAKVQQTARD